MALRQTVREEFDGYHAHLAMELHEDIPAHVEARIAEVRDFFKGQFNEGARRVEQHAREHCEMFAAALREEAHRELISVEGSSAFAGTCSGGAGASSTRRGALHQTMEVRVCECSCAGSCGARDRSGPLSAAVLDNARALAENRCERLEEGFVRERDRAAVAELVLADWGAQLREEQAMVSEFQDTALGMQAQVDEFVEQYAESTKRVIDRECSDVKKHEQDLVGRGIGVA